MSKWDITLSTTEPHNLVGTIKVRQGNVNSEVFEVTIIENNRPYDLTGLRVFFCTRFPSHALIEKEARIINPKQGIVRFILDADCMQKVSEPNAYFEIYKTDALMASTQDFNYEVISGIEKETMNAESYIQRLEDLLARVDDATEEVYKELEKQIEEIKKFFEQNREEFNEWFESVRDILESIDPGGVLLSEVIKARKNYKNLNERLEADKKELELEISKKLSTSDFFWELEKLKNNLFTLETVELNLTRTLQDDDFTKNHEHIMGATVTSEIGDRPLVIATVDSKAQQTFYFEKVGEI